MAFCDNHLLKVILGKYEIVIEPLTDMRHRMISISNKFSGNQSYYSGEFRIKLQHLIGFLFTVEIILSSRLKSSIVFIC